MAVMVNADNFVRAETHRMFADLQRDAGGVGGFGTIGSRHRSTSRLSSA